MIVLLRSLLILGHLIFIASVHANDHNNVVRLGVLKYEPYAYDEGNGLAIDIYREAFEQVGLKLQIQVYPIKRGVRMLLNNKIDAFSHGHIFFNKKDLMKINWTPTFKVAVCWFYYKPHQAGIKYESLSDMIPYQLAAIVNSPYSELYNDLGLSINYVGTPEQLVKLSFSGRVDFFESSLLAGYDLINKLYPEKAHLFGYIMREELEPSLAFLKASSRSQKIKSEFSVGLEILKENGTYMKILERYWGRNNVPSQAVLNGVRHDPSVVFNIETFNQHANQRYKKP